MLPLEFSVGTLHATLKHVTYACRPLVGSARWTGLAELPNLRTRSCRTLRAGCQPGTLTILQFEGGHLEILSLRGALVGVSACKPAVELPSCILPFCISFWCLVKATCCVPSVAEMKVSCAGPSASRAGAFLNGLFQSSQGFLSSPLFFIY